MHTNIYLLILISLLAGFFMRPLNTFVLGKVISVVKHTNSKPLVLLIFFASVLTTFGVTISAIYLALKLSGFIPLAGNTPVFLVSFFVGGAIWVVYAKKFNRVCSINLD